MTLPVILELLLTGALAGLLAGFFGIGGGAVLTPLCLAIYPALGLYRGDMIKIIFGTNMFLVMIFSISAVLKHHHNKNIEWRTVLIMGPLAILGSLIGARIASVTDPAILKRAFAVILMFSSVMIVFRDMLKAREARLSEDLPLVSEKWLPLLGFITGMIGSMLGIGGGSVMIMPLILIFKIPLERIAGTSSSVIMFIGLAGTLSYMFQHNPTIELPGWSIGYVWWSAAIPLMVGGVPMAQVGAWLNAKTHDRLLKRIFALALFIIAIKMAV